jgi:hypothetical protein
VIREKLADFETTDDVLYKKKIFLGEEFAVVLHRAVLKDTDVSFTILIKDPKRAHWHRASYGSLTKCIGDLTNVMLAAEVWLEKHCTRTPTGHSFKKGASCLQVSN